MKKKIAIVVPSVAEGGGVPNVAEYIYDILGDYDRDIISISTSRKDLNSVKICSPKSWFKGISTSSFIWRNKKVTHIGAFLSELEFMRYLPNKKLTQMLDEYDLVQVVAGAPAWAMVAKNLKIPVCLQVATLVENERANLIKNSSGLKKMYWKIATKITSRLEKDVIRSIDAIFVENEWMFEYMRASVNENKVVLAYPGIDTNIFKPCEYVESPYKYFISVGRFNDVRKNLRLMFHAFSKTISDSDIECRLLLVGLAGPSSADWDYARKLGIYNYVEYKSDVTTNDLVKYLNGAVAFISSSAEEGLGIAMLESMACGVPVIATDSGGPSAFINHGVNGFLVGIEDFDDLSKKMTLLSENSDLRAKFSVNSLMTIEEKFSNQVTALQFVNKYEELLDK